MTGQRATVKRDLRDLREIRELRGTSEHVETGIGSVPEPRAARPGPAPCLQVTTPPATSQKGANWEAELQAKLGLLSGSARRSAYALQVDAEAIVRVWGDDNTVFVTLTFGGGKWSRAVGPSVRQAQARFDSWLSHEGKKIFPGGLKVLERGKLRGRVHFHALCDAGEDVRSGVNFEAMERGDRSSFGPRLLQIQAELNASLQRYGFGKIVECDPIKSRGEAIARYVCKYISKHFDQRQTRDKGARLRSYWGTARPLRVVKSCQFSWGGHHGERGWLWRQKLAGLSQLNGVKDSSEWVRKFGPRWCWHLGPFVEVFPLQRWATKRHAEKDGVDVSWLPAGAVDISHTVKCTIQETVLFGKELLYLIQQYEGAGVKFTPESGARPSGGTVTTVLNGPGPIVAIRG